MCKRLSRGRYKSVGLWRQQPFSEIRYMYMYVYVGHETNKQLMGPFLYIQWLGNWMDQSQGSNQCSRLYTDGNGPSSLGFRPGMPCFQGTSLEVRSWNGTPRSPPSPTQWCASHLLHVLPLLTVWHSLTPRPSCATLESSALSVCPMYSFGQLPHKIRCTTPAWNGSTDLVCLSEQGAGHYSLVDQWVAWLKMETLVHIGLLTKHWCWEGSIVVIRKLSVWLKGQCSFQFLLMVNRMVSSIEFRCRWNRWIRLCGNAFRVLATYPEGDLEFTGTESSVFHIFHYQVGSKNWNWWADGSTKGLLVHFPSVGLVGGIEAELQGV